LAPQLPLQQSAFETQRPPGVGMLAWQSQRPAVQLPLQQSAPVEQA
jgi:hypothetical protein